MECKELCGNCSNGEPCHHVDGTCPHGCEAGIYGEKCNKGNARIKFFQCLNVSLAFIILIDCLKRFDQIKILNIMITFDVFPKIRVIFVK